MIGVLGLELVLGGSLSVPDFMVKGVGVLFLLDFFEKFVYGGGGGFVGVGTIVFKVGVRRLTGFSATT